MAMICFEYVSLFFLYHTEDFINPFPCPSVPSSSSSTAETGRRIPRPSEQATRSFRQSYPLHCPLKAAPAHGLLPLPAWSEVWRR